MLAKFAQAASDHIARIKEDVPLDDESLQSPNTSAHFTADDRPKTPTSSETPSKFLKKLRSPSIVARQSQGSLSSLDSDSSRSSFSTIDSVRCNNANLPNKITGEMGIEIYPCSDDGEEVIVKYTHDRHFQYVHPNVFAPAKLVNVQRMGGGGSGVSVFSGTHPELGDIVMKHGGFSDMKELFALGTISAELTRRGGTSSGASVSSKYMKACLPEFKMVYISPQHVLYKQKAVWGKLKKLVRIGRDKTSKDSFASLAMKIELSERLKTLGAPLISLSDSRFLGAGANIRIFECDCGNPTAYIEDCTVTSRPSLNFVLPKDHIRSVDNSTLALDRTQEFDSLHHLYEGLSPLMTKHLFKFTLAQKRIGGPDAKTGSQWLYEGKLDGLLLDNLIAKFVETVRNLQALTLPEEVDVRAEIRKELRELQESDVQSDGLSTMADQFMGNAIKKNFHPTKGRIRFLKRTCRDFKGSDVFLLPEEEFPAKLLAALGEPNAFMSDVFVGASSEPPLFHPDKDFWINLMIQATSDRGCMSSNATKRIWTSGLCDAGIHNLFVSKDELYFFDLGVPQLQSLPGFMTKFLFSFFHILGMEEDESSKDGEWVRRFVAQGDKLALTKETTELLPKAYDAFEVALNRIIEEIFEGDQTLRWLLLEYVTLQLLSDASFCLQRWSMKGGGRPRDDKNHNQGLERWLWRALWDIYVAFDINTIESWQRLEVEHPSCSDLHTSAIGDSLRGSIRKSICEDADFEELLKLDQLMDQIDEEKESERHDHEPAPFEPSMTPRVSRSSQQSATTPRHSRQARKSSLLRWSSERLSQSTLRELTAAHFEYKDSDDESQHSDDDEDDSSTNSSESHDSGILPPCPPLYSLDEDEES